MTKEELEKELEEIKDFKVYVFEGDVYVKAEDFRKKAIECRKLKEELAKEGIRMDMMNHYNEIKEENEKLREEIKEIEKSQEYRYHRCMVAERGGEDNS